MRAGSDVDDELREHQRRVHVSPDDLDAWRAYGAALGRNGHRRMQLLILAFLARKGDVDAGAEFTRACPWPGPDGAGRTRSLDCAPPRGELRVRVATLHEEDLALDHPDVWAEEKRHRLDRPVDAVGLIEHTLVMRSERGLVSLDVATLATRVTAIERPLDGPCVLFGADALIARAGTLSAYELDGGERVAVAELDGHITWVDVIAGVGVALVDARQVGYSIVAFELVGEQFGRMLWSRPISRAQMRALCVAGRLYHCGARPDLLESIELATGRSLPPVALTSLGETELLAGDADGVLLGVGTALEERAPDGRLRWRAQGARAPTALGPDVLAFLTTQASSTVLVVIDRARGQERWRRELPVRPWDSTPVDPDFSPKAPEITLAITREVVFAIVMDEGSLALEAFALEDGSRRGDARVPLVTTSGRHITAVGPLPIDVFRDHSPVVIPAFVATSGRGSSLNRMLVAVPVAGGVLAVVAGAGGTIAVRMEGAEPP